MSFQPIPGVERSSGTIHRPRLLEKLGAVSNHKLTLICAPPGYGKTTIAAQFANQSSYQIAWHSVEERERDVPNLHKQSLATLSHIVPNIRTLEPLPNHAPSELAARVANHLRENVTHDIIYILDDVHHIREYPAAEMWLRTLVAMIPPYCHLILISRMLPNLPLTEMIARREVFALGQEQLRFTFNEISTLAHDVLSLRISEVEVERLTSRLEGWPAGTMLALQPLPNDLEWASLNGGDGPEALFDALADSMLHGQPKALRDFLLASSTLSPLTPELCSTVLQISGSSHWLSEVQSRNLFVSKATGGLVYHGLFREFLQRQLQNQDEKLFIDLHTRAARWFEKNNHVDKALDHYLEAKKIHEAAAIVERVAHAYFVQGRVETLLNWKAQLDDDIKVPKLLYVCAMIHTDRYDYETAISELDEAEKSFFEYNDDIGIGNVQVQRAMIGLQKGSYRQAAAHAMQSLQQLPVAQTKLRGRALRVLGVAQLRLGQITEAIARLEEALPLYRADGDAYTTSQLLQDIGVAYAQIGRLEDACAWLQEVVALRRALGSTDALSLALNNLGFYYHLGGYYDRAMSVFQEGLSLVASIPNKRAESYLLWSMGDLLRDLGAFDESLPLYFNALKLIEDSEPSLHCGVLVSISTHRRWQGKFDEAIVIANEALELATMHHIALATVTARAAGWTARAQLGEAAQALDELSEIVENLRELRAQTKLVQTLGLAAHAALLCDDSSRADYFLKSALHLTQEQGSKQPLVVEVAYTPLLESHISNGKPQYDMLIDDLIRLRSAQWKTPHYNINVIDEMVMQVTYSLRVLTLGRDQIEHDGKSITSTNWRSTTAREMFLYLLFKGPENREQISLVFWPDSSSKRVRSNFHTTLYRARKALGEGVLIFQDGLYLIHPEINIWCDAHLLESLTGQARLLSPRDARAEDLWREAVSLYNGDFLPTIYSEWVYSFRDSLKEAYLEALVGAGECARARMDLIEAIDFFERALEVDPYRENTHRALMACYAERGDKKRVLAYFRMLRELLIRDLAIEPSRKTTEFVESLLGAN